jgi:hypothetical protein
MKSTQQEIRYQFLDSIMKERNVTYKSIYECGENKITKKEIDNMNRIFDSDDELSIRKRQVLLSLVSQDQAEKNLEYYQNFKGFHAGSIDSDIDKYKTVLIAALMSNTLFFIRTCNWCGLIQREAANHNVIHRPNAKQVRRFPRTKKLSDEKKLRRLTGDDSGHRLRGFDYLHVDDISGYSGVFTFLGNEQDRRLKVEFQFSDKTAGEKLEADTIPFYLKIKLIPEFGKSLPITLNIKDGSSTICSNEEYFNFSKRYKVGKIIHLIPYVEDASND